MHRFYFPDSDFNADQITLTDKQELHHLQHVLRLKVQDKIIVFNGKNKEAQGIILSLDKKKVIIKIATARHVANPLPNIILACAIPKKGKFEFILEKATELGVSEIIPLKTQRTEIHLTKERFAKKQKRFEAIVINASKQCRRPTIPQIYPLTTFEAALTNLTQAAQVLFPCLTGERKPIFEALKEIDTTKAIAIIIGPEGDFTPQECTLAKNKKCIPV